jgi:hypothetical protein
MKGLADADHIVARFPRGADAEVRITFRIWQRRPHVDVRIFPGGSPTLHRIVLRVGELVDVAAALQRAVAHIVRAYGGPMPKTKRTG